MRKIKTIALAALLIIGLVITAIPVFIPVAKAADSWTLVNDARGVKAYPDLREYVWQKNASMPPNAQYDKIGLHRLVKTGTTPKGVVFICPGYSSGVGESTSNPPGDNWTKLENFTQAIYWANRGFDVYAVDYRMKFVPNTLNASQLSFMQDWGWDVMMSDVKEAISKAKEVSGAMKVFIVGHSQGAGVALNYASKYWKDDLRGIILLSSYLPSGSPSHLAPSDTPVAAKRGNETNTFNLTSVMNTLISGGNWSVEGLTLQTILLFKYAFENPGAPAQYPPGAPLTPAINPMTNKTWANITEWASFAIYNAQGPGATSNIYGGYGNVTIIEQQWSVGTRYVPSRIYAESAAMVDWVNCPYLTYDYDDHYKEIGVPLLAFEGLLYANRTGTFRFVNGINNTDFTGIALPKYGHYDIFYGTYSARDISAPAYDWMYRHIFNLEKATVQGTYRDWTVLLLENRIYLYPPATSSGLPPIQSIGTWDPEYYGKLGWTAIDAAKPYIDMCMTCPYVRWS
jgi:pimeloyl-ACP methyl ester carboxylesterase